MLRSLVPLAKRRWCVIRDADPRPPHEQWADLMADLRYGARLSRRSPLASFAIVATMALGVASTTVVFSATSAVLLRSLPFVSSDRVVRLRTTVPGGAVVNSLAYPDLMDFRRSVHDFSDLTIFAERDVTLQHGTNPQLVHSLQADDAYARVFALRPELGRLVLPGDTIASAPKVAILAHDFWMREFGGDRSLLGRVITLDNEPVHVVGILGPSAYIFPRVSIDLLTPLRIPANSFMRNRGALWAGAAARLKPAATAEQAERDLASVSRLLKQQFPNSNRDLSARVQPLREAVTGSVQEMLELLAAAIASVLLIACINVANLILGRAQTRSREFAVRTALGGSPARVRRQVLTESLMLASVGGAIGLMLAPLLLHALIAIYPDALPRAEEISINASVLLVACVATVGAGVLAAIPTVRRVARLELSRHLRDGGRSGAGWRDRRNGRVLVATQVAASVALLFSAGLLLRTFWRLERVEPGFDSRRALAFHLYAPAARYKSATEIERYYTAVLEALRASPGVRDAATMTVVPFGNDGGVDTFIQQERGDQGPGNPHAVVSASSSEFDRALGVPLLAGRSFTAGDDTASEHVVMINAAAARKVYAGENPVGRSISWNGQAPWRIVGVLGSTHLFSLSEEPPPMLYVPAPQAIRRSRYVVVRSDASTQQVLAAARSALRWIDPTIALTDVATMDERIRRSLGAARFRAALMATLGALALALSIVGIYGVVSYSVSRRTREIGIRMALGEAAHAVRRRVVLDACRIASAGLVIGSALALLSGKWLTGFLVGVEPNDLEMLGLAVVLLAAVILLAAYGPARRAARVDPVTALRAE